ncbi:MAG: flagellar protein FlaG [Colwellia sp.]|nr:flagellar protein FlaG [Colwellia sp.]
MSINAFKNNQVVSLDDLTSSGNASKQQTNAIDKDLTKAIALEKITAVEVKKSEELSKKLEINQEQLNKDKLAQEAESLDQSVNVSDAMKTISEFINMPVRTVNFTQDDGSERTVIKIFDSESKELIKQFPSEEILSIAQRIIDLQQDISQKTGILLDENI